VGIGGEFVDLGKTFIDFSGVFFNNSDNVFFQHSDDLEGFIVFF